MDKRVVLSLFDGISCGQVALNNAGIRYDRYLASEVDKNAIEVTQKNYPLTEQLGDANKVDISKLPKIWLLMGGSPCQSFSVSGNNKGFHDPRGQLFYKFVEILHTCKPKFFLFENVGMKRQNENIMTRNIGVKPIKLNSIHFSAQNRKRLYWTNIPINSKKPINNQRVIDILFDDRSENYYLPEHHKVTIKRKYAPGRYYKVCRVGYYGNGSQSQRIYSVYGKSPCLMANSSSFVPSFLDTKTNRSFKLRTEEVELLQGLLINYTSGYSDAQRRKMIGNGWSIPTIVYIMNELKNV